MNLVWSGVCTEGILSRGLNLKFACLLSVRRRLRESAANPCLRLLLLRKDEWEEEFELPSSPPWPLRPDTLRGAR